MTISRRLLGERPAGIEIRELSWSAGGRAIVTDMSFAVAPGETIAVVGPNGAGKSSLLRCLYRYQRPSSGAVLLDGRDIWSLPARECARRIATVLQEPASDFGLTVAETVALGLTPHQRGWGETDYGAVEAALTLMGLDDLAYRDLATLSGGERQRAAIARALVQRPDLLVLDEPTNHLDIRHQLEVLAMLRALPVTVVVSLHDLALASSHADRVLIVDGGRRVAFGRALDILTPQTVEATFGVRTTIDRHPATGDPRFSFHLAEMSPSGVTPCE